MSPKSDVSDLGTSEANLANLSNVSASSLINLLGLILRVAGSGRDVAEVVDFDEAGKRRAV
jgi:hypothetical protein